MKQILVTKNILFSITMLNELNEAADETAKRIEVVADILEQIDNNLEVENE